MDPGPGRASPVEPPVGAGGGEATALEAARQAQKEALPAASTPERVTFEDVAVGFSAEEWSLLKGSQKDLHQEVMLEMCSLLLSLGHSVPALDVSSLICQPEGTADSPSPSWGRRLPFAAGGDKAHCRDQSSHHLCALMKLVKEIPEFLCRHTHARLDRATPAGGSEGSGHAGPAVQTKSFPHVRRQGALADWVPPSLSSRPGTPHSGTEGDGPESSRRGSFAPCAAQGPKGADVATNTEPAAEEDLAEGQLKCEDEDLLQRPCLLVEQKGSPQTDPRLGLCPADADDPPADVGCLGQPSSWREGGADGPTSPGTSRSIACPGSRSEEGKVVPEAAAEWGAPKSTCRASPRMVPEATAEEKPLQGLVKCPKERIVLQRCPDPQVSHTPSIGSWPQAPGGGHRAGGSSLLPVQVKTEASGEEPGACRPGEGPGPPAASWGHTSTCQPEGSQRAGSPDRKEGRPFPAVKAEKMTSSPPWWDLERAAGVVVRAGGSGERAPDGSSTSAVRVKSEAAAEEEPPLRGRKDVWEEEGHPRFGPPRSSSSLGTRESRSKLGLWVPYSADWSPATSPLHGLLNCLKDIPVPRPRPSRVLVGKTGAAAEKERWKGGRRGRIGPPPDTFVPQGPDAGLGEKPAQQPLLPLGCANGARGRDPAWRKLETATAQEGLGTPLQGQEGGLKERPPSAQMQPCSPAASSSVSSSPNRPPWWTPEQGTWRRKEEELGHVHSPSEGLGRGLQECPLGPRSQASSPATSSCPDGLPRWAPEPMPWARGEEGLGQNSSPLQGLEKCLRAIQKQRWSPAVSSSVSGSPDRLRQWTPEPGRWAGMEEGASPPRIPPLQGLENCLKEIALSRAFLPDANPAGRSIRAQKGQGTEVGSPPRPWPGESFLQPCAPSISASPPLEAGAENSPLHRLMNCLKEIPIQRPSYLNTPSVSSSSSSSSSSCSEAERDQRSPGSAAWWDCGQGRHPLLDTFRGSKVDALVGQKVTMESERKHPSIHRPPEEEERLPSTQESNFVDVGDKAPSASLLGNLGSDAKDPVARQTLSSSDPPLCSSAQQDAASGTSEARDDGAPSAPLADRVFSHEMQDGPRDAAPVQTPACSSTAAPGGRERTPEGEAGWSRVEAQPQPQPGPKAKRRGAARPQDLPGYLAEIPAHLPHGSQRPPGSPRDPLEPRGEEGKASGPSVAGEGVTASSPLQGLLRCLKEITHESTGPCPPLARKRPRESGQQQQQEEEEEEEEEEAANSRKRSWEARDQGSPASDAAPSPADTALDAAPKKRRPGLDPSSPPRSCGTSPSPERPAEAGGPLLSKQLGRLAADVSALGRDLARLQGHVLGLEREARGWALELAALRLEHRGLGAYARRLESRCRALESRSRRRNLRLLGLPEGAEGGDAAAFLRRALPGLLGWASGVPVPEVESARRVHGGAARDAHGKPRPLVFRLVRLADKAAVLEAARARTLRYAGAQVAILPDLPSSLARRRRVPLGTGRRARWVANLLCGAQPSPWGLARTQALREPPAGRAPLPHERAGRAAKGSWGAAPSTGPHGGGHSPGSCEPHNP